MGKEWGDTLKTGGEIGNSSFFFLQGQKKNREEEVDKFRRVEEIPGQTNGEPL